MKHEDHHPQRNPENAETRRGKALFFAILGLIIFFFVVLLVLKPRGAGAQAPPHEWHPATAVSNQRHRS